MAASCNMPGRRFGLALEGTGIPRETLLWQADGRDKFHLHILHSLRPNTTQYAQVLDSNKLLQVAALTSHARKFRTLAKGSQAAMENQHTSQFIGLAVQCSEW